MEEEFTNCHVSCDILYNKEKLNEDTWSDKMHETKIKTWNFLKLETIYSRSILCMRVI